MLAEVSSRRPGKRKKVFPSGSVSVVGKYLNPGFGRDGVELSTQQLIDHVRAGLPYSELEILQRSFGLPMEYMASQVGLSRATWQRRKKEDGVLSPLQSDRVVRLARLMGKAIQVLESEENARQWLTTPQYGLGGAAPLDYSDTEVGAREVENLLGRIEHGVFS